MYHNGIDTLVCLSWALSAIPLSEANNVNEKTTVKSTPDDKTVLHEAGCIIRVMETSLIRVT